MKIRLGVLCLGLMCQITAGCAHTALNQQFVAHDIPRELEMVSHPTYRVAPPDILMLDAVNTIRRADSQLRPGDTVSVQVADGLPLDFDAEFDTTFDLELETTFKHINNNFLVGPDGMIDLGPIYGKISIAGASIPEASERVTNHLRGIGAEAAKVSLVLVDLAAEQEISGEHLVRPDGTISLGTYGNLYVSGMTLEEIKHASESHLAAYLDRPKVHVDVLAYNSQGIYVITDGGGFGEQVIRLPSTGNDTVLDAVAQIEGLSQVSSRNIWVARPAPSGTCCAQVMPVNWREIAAEGVTTTNYQLLPGDRIYIQADRLIALDNVFAKIISPVERVFGVVLLGDSMLDSFRITGNRNN